MTFAKLEEPLDRPLSDCTSIIIMNDKYQESLDLLVSEYMDKGIYYFPAKPDTNFIDPDSERLMTINSHGGTTGSLTYNQMLLDSYRGRAPLTITESLENELADFSYDGGGTYYSNSTDPRKEYANRPLDFWLNLSTRGHAFAVAIESTTIEDAISSLNDAIFDFGKKHLPNVLKVAYFNGERYAITEGQIKEILVSK